MPTKAQSYNAMYLLGLVLVQVLPTVHAHTDVETLAEALHQARIAEPLLATRVLTQTLGLDAEGPWLADVQAFDDGEREEMFAALRKEGVTLADRSRLRRLASAGVTQPVPDGENSPRRSAQSSEGDSGGASLEAMAIAVTALLGVVSYVVQARSAVSDVV